MNTTTVTGPAEQVVVVTSVGLTAIAADHGRLLGLDHDDHPQYLTEGRAGDKFAPVAHTHSAVETSYDNVDSNLPATDVKGAIDALKAVADVGIIEYAAAATALPNPNNIWTAVNIMDWTSHAQATGTALDIRENHVVTFGNGGGIAYRWVGEKPVLVGLGQLPTTADDFVAIATLDHDTFINVLPDQHHDQAHLLYGKDHSDVDLATALVEGDVLSWDATASKFIPKIRVNWVGPYVAGLHNTGDMVTHDRFTMIANKPTNDPAAPQNVGDRLTSLTPGAAFTEDSAIAVINVVTTITTLVDGAFKELYVKVPLYDTDSVVRVIIEDIISGEISTYNSPILLSGEWVLIRETSVIYSAGAILKVTLEFYNSSAASTITGGWNNNLDGNLAAVPAINDIIMDDGVNPIRIAINHVDLDGTDRITELQGVAIDSIILVSETGSPDRNVECKVTAVDITSTTFVDYTVVMLNQNREVRDGRTCTVNIDVPITQPGQYYKFVDYYINNQPTFATVATGLYYDGVAQPVSSNDAYGIYVTFQELLRSPDWDFVSLP